MKTKVKWRRRIIISAFIMIVVAAIIYGFIPKPIPVDTAPVKRGPMRVTIDEEGKARVIDRYGISSPVAGFLHRIELKPGDRVIRDQILGELEPLRPNFLDSRSRAQARARVASAQAALHAAREDAQAASAVTRYAEKELERVRQLHASGYASQDNLDEAQAKARQTQASHRSAEFAVEIARFELEAARTALQYSAEGGVQDTISKIVIRAPVAGCVLNIHRQSEGVVEAGHLLLEVGDPNALEVAADVLSADAVNIGAGMPVIFDRWGGDEYLEGRVRIVEPYAFTKVSTLGVEEQRVLVIADITSSHQRWERLGDGYRLEAHFILWEDDNVLQIPASAAFRYGENWAVFVVKDDRAQRRLVKIGHRSGLTAEAISGLVEWEVVITHPDESIEDGSHIYLR